MEWMNLAILVGAGLIALSTLTSAVAFRFSAPLLLVFLCIGLIAGEDGLGLVFNDAEAAYFLGSLALAIILFDSGFGTRTQTLKRAAAPAFVLATVGVLLTTVFVGLAAHFLFDLPWLHAMLMGAIISSTDAAAVFFLLRTGGVKIYKRVRSMLEVESGSNDPMAIFLTVLFIELILSDKSVGLASSFLQGFGLQMGLGIAAGLVGGFLIVEIVNRITLEEALYPILVLSCALCIFAVTAHFGGSGFLAVYVAGIVAGNRAMKGASRLRRYQQGMTWLAQIVMFLVLGLFVTPSEFGAVLLPALLLGLFLIAVGRPLAVVLCLLPFRLDQATVGFSAWVGLRGAVSILLGILPTVMGVENADIFINVAFIMVLTSLVVQGWTIKPAARWLKLIVPSEAGPLERIELELPGSPGHDLLVYRVLPDCPCLAHRAALPAGAQTALVIREGQMVGPEAAWPLQPDDLIYLFATPELLPQLDRLFAQFKSRDASEVEFFGEFSVDPHALMPDLAAVYGLTDPALTAPFLTVGDYMEDRLRGRPVVGDRVPMGQFDLVVQRVHQGQRIAAVGLSFAAAPSTEASRRAAAATAVQSAATSLRRWFRR
jgi:potassium/hydrogen antiporter